jgi:hypothetical protein
VTFTLGTLLLAFCSDMRHQQSKHTCSNPLASTTTFESNLIAHTTADLFDEELNSELKKSPRAGAPKVVVVVVVVVVSPSLFSLREE